MSLPSPTGSVRLTFAVEAGGPTTIAALSRAVDEAGLAGGEWSGYRRQALLWDDPDATLAARGLELSTTGARSAAVACLLVPGGAIQPERHERPCPDGLPPLDALAEAAGLTLPEAVAIAGRRSLTGRVVPLPGGVGRIAVEIVAQQDAIGDRRDSRILLEAPAATAASAVRALRPLAARLPLRLATGTRPGTGAVRTAPEALRPDITAGAAFLATGRAATRQIMGNLDRLADAPHVEAVHQLRVGIRRLRAALGLFRECLDDTARRALASDLRDMAKRFGPSRDLDVFAAEILAPLRAAVDPSVALEAAAEAVEGARAAARTEAVVALGAPETFACLLELLAWFEAGGVPYLEAAERPVMRHARKSLRRRRRRLIAHHAAGPVAVEEWHALRIEAKKLRYATDAFASLYPPEATKPFVRALQEVQDCLGRYNDAAVADTTAVRLAFDALSRGAVAGWAARERVEQGRRFERAWRRLRKCRKFW